MGGRSTAGDNPVKTRRRKTATPSRGDALKAERIPGPTVDDLRKELDRRTHELHEALEQQTAAGEVLRVISSSPRDLAPVLQTILANATRLCAANFGLLALYENGQFRRPDAVYNLPEAFIALRRRQGDIHYGPKNPLTRLAATKEAQHIFDCRTDVAFLDGEEAWVQLVELTHARSMLLLPMLKGSELVGAIAIYRLEVLAFTDKQYELVQNFAAQAVIAIENARLLNELRQRTTDLTESLEQQTATSDVLRVISSSPTDIQPVLETIGERAEKLCNAEISVVSILDGELIRLASIHGMTEAGVEATRRDFPMRRADEGITARAIRTRSVCHVADVLSDPGYQYKDTARVVSHRSCLGVPMVRDEQVVGAILVARRQPGLFSDTQVRLLKTFADQAVIAIENVRLFNETKNSLEQQTATSDVLKIISRSTFDLQTVLDTLVQSAVLLCEADTAAIARQGGDGLFHQVASHGYSPELNEFMARHPIPSGRGSISGRVINDRHVVHIADAQNDPQYALVEAAEVGGLRTMLGVPLLREGSPIGVLVLSRKIVRPFTAKQIELVETFAAQAVIAIENTQLLTELRESLQQQTATADVLAIISSSPGELKPVFQAMLENAVRICDAKFGLLFLPEGDAYRLVALHNAPPAYAEARWREPVTRFGPGTTTDRVAKTKRPVQIADTKAEPAYVNDPQRFAIVELAGARTMFAVPMLKENDLVGVIGIYRQEVRPFTDKQIELVQNFAAQAVIAIENTRLLNELRQRTDDLGRSVGELRALGEVSQAVNSTLDLETVLDTIVAKAVQLSNTDTGAIYVYDDRQRDFHLRATYGMDQELIEAFTQRRIGLDDPNVEQALTRPEPIQIADLREEASTEINEITMRAGYLARLVAPLIRGANVVGLLVVRRRIPGAFQQNTVDLIKTFAAQSAVAIENARLFKNMEASLEDLRNTQDRLVQTQKLASLGQLTAGIAHEIKNPLNFVNNFSGVSVELIDELQRALEAPQLDKKARAEIAELANTLRDNLDKVVQHGKRADSIVKNMLLHSREGSGEHRPVDINALVEEAVNLAYHGARAEKQAFNITLERSIDPTVGQVECFPQDGQRR
jgi:GAF domain-containing protein